MNKNQVKVIIKIISQKHLKDRDGLQRIFVSENHIWATDGYIAIDVCETDIENGKSVGLDKLKSWVVNAKSNDMLPTDLFADESFSFPEMSKIVSELYTKIGEVSLNAKYLYWCASFLGVENVTISHSTLDKHLYQILPFNEKEVDIMTRALESKIYLMGVR